MFMGLGELLHARRTARAVDAPQLDQVKHDLNPFEIAPLGLAIIGSLKTE
jgi:hypothetical protein